MPRAMATVHSLPEKIGDIAVDLLAYYAAYARELPWREKPGRNELPDPYHVWLSEIMLQQTTVAAVIPYFQLFTARWPDFAALAAAPEDQVMAAWAGLGYYARARNLIACARFVTEEFGGKFPSDEGMLRILPGIGPYTAAAISAFAFGRRAVVVDANIERVISRLFAIGDPLPAAKPAIRSAMDSITPSRHCGDFAQAMMDLGALVCTARNPKCGICPITKHCAAFITGNQEGYPVKAAKKPKPHRVGTAFWIERESFENASLEHGGAVLLIQREKHGMLGGMRALPDDGWRASVNGNTHPPYDAKWVEEHISVQHVFTHFTLTLRIFSTRYSGDTLPIESGVWWPIKSLDKSGLPTLFSKVVQAVISAKGREK
jgi:A/G-specific adenine glycosylase